jgi:hypothetical protein
LKRTEITTGIFDAHELDNKQCDDFLAATPTIGLCHSEAGAFFE